MDLVFQRPSQRLFLSVDLTEMDSTWAYAETCCRYLERIGGCGSSLFLQGELDTAAVCAVHFPRHIVNVLEISHRIRRTIKL